MDIYVAFTFLAWIIMLLWALMYTFLWTWFFHLGVQFLSHIVMLCLCLNNGHTFYTKPLHHFPHPPSMNEGFKISTSLSTLVICLCCYSLSRAVQWFSLSFSWWLMILNIFSWSYWFFPWLLRLFGEVLSVFPATWSLIPLHLVCVLPAPMSFLQLFEHAVTHLVQAYVVSMSFLTFPLCLVRSHFMRVPNSMKLDTKKGSVFGVICCCCCPEICNNIE